MRLSQKLVSTCLGIGYIGKGGGTVAAAAACALWYVVFRNEGSQYILWQPLLVMALLALSVWSADAMEPIWGKDDRKVVIDEAAGMGTSLLFIPVTPGYLLAGLILFRFFDIVKPLCIRRLERLPGGWGVTADDAAAGICTNIVLQIALYCQTL